MLYRIQLGMKFQLLVKTKMLKIRLFLLPKPKLLGVLIMLKMTKCQQIVGILKNLSMLKLLAFNIFGHDKFHAQLG